MANFYGVRDKKKLSKAQAMQSIQQMFIGGKVGDASYAHPYFWAPFISWGTGGEGQALKIVQFLRSRQATGPLTVIGAGS